MNSATDRQRLLRRSLQGNGLFSVLSRITILAANRQLVELLGLPAGASLLPPGIGLFCSAGWLFWVARREQIKSVDGWIAVVLDLTWVLGNWVLLGMIPFTGSGKSA